MNQKLRVKMERATDAVIDKQQEINASAAKKTDRRADHVAPIDLRTAAYVLAISRVAQVALERGIWP